MLFYHTNFYAAAIAFLPYIIQEMSGFQPLICRVTSWYLLLLSHAFPS